MLESRRGWDQLIEANSIAANVERVRERIARAAERAGRGADEITIVAASKTFLAEAIRAAYEAGLRHFGENRVQEFEAKRGKLGELDATWHLIGHLQSNKARRAAQLFDRVDSVDRFSLAEKLDSTVSEGKENRAGSAETTDPPLQTQKRLPVLIEVHLGGEETKSGVEEAGLAALAQGVAALSHLELLGLMTIPPYFDEAERGRLFFRKLRELRDGLSERLGRALPVLSMGMSHDFEVAIEEGATEVRIGTAIFGERKVSR